MTATQRREQLLEIARELFAERGFEGTSVEEIAARAGVSKPVVYEHFGGKEGAYAVVVDRETHLTARRDPERSDHPRRRLPRAGERGAMAPWTTSRCPDGSGSSCAFVDGARSGSFASILSDIAAQVEDILAGEFERTGHDPAVRGPFRPSSGWWRRLVSSGWRTGSRPGRWWRATSSTSPGTAWPTSSGRAEADHGGHRLGTAPARRRGPHAQEAQTEPISRRTFQVHDLELCPVVRVPLREERLLEHQQRQQRRIHKLQTGSGERHQHPATVGGIRIPGHRSARPQPVHPVGHRARGDVGLAQQLPRREPVRLTGPAQGGEDVELPSLDGVGGEGALAVTGQDAGQAIDARPDVQRLQRQIAAFALPRGRPRSSTSSRSSSTCAPAPARRRARTAGPR